MPGDREGRDAEGRVIPPAPDELASEVQRLRDAAREAMGPPAFQPLPPRRPLPSMGPLQGPPDLGSPVAPARPNEADVNRLWGGVRSTGTRGPLGYLRRLLRRLLAPEFVALEEFNAAQVRLDNAVLDWVEARIALTHEHYDRLLGDVGRYLSDVDERHLILQREIVTHVHDLVRRIDLVLTEAEKGRVAHEYALRELRARVQAIEERLSGR
jgi:hypothetical protein